ncbi:LLM class flavin-dependent oxidoreductase [Paenibacillus sp. sptzw28]|uniref:LLM class flavin-dependent oxidoreductase n=1 Tax=Paenibacillus sp. sptzw28 TaxID=715179 RepID=UPI001C6F2753|nr:LLM class flavin-dependent oxidoreductase [Paenibacillus sp. sptzw28]QYR22486.1 LLM class flavin-dependent oxidoreductase [Paenibacillus sp. sptzw28]
MLRLSVLDQSPVPEGSTAARALQETVKLAQLAERLGYHRFWVSEHHNMASLAHSSPEVFISHIAAQTASIRVGSGGVMLPHYSAYKVAENFRLLEALYPGRIDLGLGRAPGGMPIATRALQEGKIGGIDKYPQQIKDLLHYLHDSNQGEHRFAGLKAVPSVSSAPEIWLLGSSGDSAMLAAERGVSFAFAQFINGAGGAAAVKEYRDTFTPDLQGDKPKALVSIFVVCAETEDEAERLASSFDYQFVLLEQGRLTRGVVPPEQALAYPYSPIERQRLQENRKRMVVGSPDTVKEQLLRLAEEYGTDEIMIATIVHDYEAKRRSYKLLAEAFGLG